MTLSQLKSLCSETLNEGLDKYGLMMGIVSYINNGKYEIFAVSSETGIPHVGDVYDLQAVYCREVFKKNKTIAITEINGVLGMCLHPLHDYIPCEAYISSPIVVDNKVWGTLNYTSLEKREMPFNTKEIKFNDKKASLIASAISQTIF